MKIKINKEKSFPIQIIFNEKRKQNLTYEAGKELQRLLGFAISQIEISAKSRNTEKKE